MNGVEKVAALKVIPVIAIDDAKDASPLAGALCAGGLPAAEITFRTAAAEDAIKIVAKEYPDMLVGAAASPAPTRRNVLLTPEPLSSSPLDSIEVFTEYAVKNNIPIYPGICTPTEMMFLLEYDLPVAKFFPAEQFGGLATIKAISAPFPNMKFMPTGGINASNVLDYLSFDKIIACGGSWMVKKDLISSGRFDKIEALTREAVELVKTAKK